MRTLQLVAAAALLVALGGCSRPDTEDILTAAKSAGAYPGGGSSSSGPPSPGASGSGGGSGGNAPASSGGGQASFPGSSSAASVGSGPSGSSDSDGSGAAQDAGADAGDDASSDDDGSSSDPLAAARDQCVQIINMYRATLSPPSAPLTQATSQSPCVDGQAKADALSNTPHSAFGNCGENAQDECPGWPGPPTQIDTSCLAQMWAEGPPPAGQDNHWLNMENPQATQVACGFYQTSSGDWWATQDFY
jgi:hypothetical protein